MYLDWPFRLPGGRILPDRLTRKSTSIPRYAERMLGLSPGNWRTRRETAPGDLTILADDRLSAAAVDAFAKLLDDAVHLSSHTRARQASLRRQVFHALPPCTPSSAGPIALRARGALQNPIAAGLG